MLFFCPQICTASPFIWTEKEKGASISFYFTFTFEMYVSFPNQWQRYVNTLHMYIYQSNSRVRAIPVIIGLIVDRDISTIGFVYEQICMDICMYQFFPFSSCTYFLSRYVHIYLVLSWQNGIMNSDLCFLLMFSREILNLFFLVLQCIVWNRFQQKFQQHDHTAAT